MNRRKTLVEAAGAGMVAETATKVGRYGDGVGWPVWVTDTRIVEDRGQQAIAWYCQERPNDLGWAKEQYVLDAILDLADSLPRSVAAFVRKYGPLEICSHGYSWYDHRCCAFGKLQNPQPVETFRNISLEFGALLRLAAAGRRSRAGDLSDWAFLEGFGDSRPKLPERRDPWAARWAVSDWVSWWMQKTGMAAFLTWPSKDQIEFHLGSLGPLSAGAKQLAFTVAQIDALAVCSECGKPFIPKRRRPQSRRAYCQKCGKRASDRRAQRDKRERERANRSKSK
jgi:hypothetical protein